MFVEIGPSLATAYVRDKGCGFEPGLVRPERGGIAQSIRARMERYGGRAEFATSPGEGTEVKLQVVRAP